MSDCPNHILIAKTPWSTAKAEPCLPPSWLTCLHTWYCGISFGPTAPNSQSPKRVPTQKLIKPCWNLHQYFNDWCIKKVTYWHNNNIWKIFQSQLMLVKLSRILAGIHVRFWRIILHVALSLHHKPWYWWFANQIITCRNNIVTLIWIYFCLKHFDYKIVYRYFIHPSIHYYYDDAFNMF